MKNYLFIVKSVDLKYSRFLEPLRFYYDTLNLIFASKCWIYDGLWCHAIDQKSKDQRINYLHRICCYQLTDCCFILGGFQLNCIFPVYAAKRMHKVTSSIIVRVTILQYQCPQTNQRPKHQVISLNQINGTSNQYKKYSNQYLTCSF